jgi:hypothetical protein
MPNVISPNANTRARRTLAIEVIEKGYGDAALATVIDAALTAGYVQGKISKTDSGGRVDTLVLPTV